MFEVAHINDSLGEEDSVIINHQEDMVQVHVLSLSFVIVQSN